MKRFNSNIPINTYPRLCLAGPSRILSSTISAHMGMRKRMQIVDSLKISR